MSDASADGGVSSAIFALFGTEDAVARQEAVAWLKSLRYIWSLQAGSDFGDLEDDLRKLDLWFDPSKPGSSIREALDRLKPVDAGRELSLPFGPAREILVQPVHNGRVLVSPEGRAFGALLEELIRSPGEETVRIDARATLSIVAVLASDYRRSSRAPLIRIAALLGDNSAESLRPAAAGLLFFMLANRNLARERAIPKYPTDRQLGRLVSQAIARPVSAFAKPVSRKPDVTRAVDVYRGWAFGELARRLGSGFVGDRGGSFIHDEAAARRLLLRYVRTRLRGRASAASQAIDTSFMELAAIRPTLNGLGIGFERPSHSQRLRQELQSALAADASERTAE